MKITDVVALVVRVGGDETYMGPPEPDSAKLPGGLFRRPHYPIIFSEQTQTVLVRVETDVGLVGWGEAQAPVAPEITQAAITHLVRHYLLGRDPHDSAVLWEELFQGMRSRGHVSSFYLDALAACDIALWDLRGQDLGVPITTLLGGAHRRSVPVYASGVPTGLSVEDRVRFVKDVAASGFTAVKLKLGMGVDADIANVRAVRQALPDFDIMVDAHWAFSVSEALRLGHALGEMRVSFLESPLWSQDRRGLQKLTEQLLVPIAGGEELRTRHEFLDLMKDGAFDVAQPDVGRCGITELMRIASLVDAFQRPCAMHVGVGLGIYLAASLQCAAAIPNLLVMEHQPLMLKLGNEMLTEPLICRDGHYEVPAGPGLGSGVDLDRLRDLGWQVLEPTE